MTQLELFPENSAMPLLAEADPTTSASNLGRLRQQIYQCSSHGRKYFKYVCSIGHHLAIQCWIPGGNIANRTAQRRAAQVKSWIKAGVPPREIERRIKLWSTHKRAQKPQISGIQTSQP
jgi:hypothetical protein